MVGIAALALRCAIVNLLRDQTSAGLYVYDSPIRPAERIAARSTEMANAARNAPMIGVFCHHRGGDSKVRELTSHSNRVNLALCIYLPPTATRLVEGLEVDHIEYGTGLAFDLIAGQIRKAMFVGPENWRAIHEDLVVNIERTAAISGQLDISDSIAVPVMKLMFRANLIPEPQLGKAITGTWQRLDSALRATAGFTPVAELIRELIETPPSLAPWRRDQADLAASLDEMRALGLAPLDPTEHQIDPALLDQITVSGRSTVYHPGLPGEDA